MGELSSKVMISVSVSDAMQGTVLNEKSFLFLNLSESPNNSILFLSCPLRTVIPSEFQMIIL